MATIGFVGLGHMGLPMAINLLKAGHVVRGFDLVQEAKDKIVAAGGLAAANLQDVTNNTDVIITMLQTGQQVLQVCLGTAQESQGLFQQAKPGTLFIDCSTIDVNSSREFHQMALKHQHIPVDAPVSGGVAGATAATLTFMVGGEEKAFSVAKPLLSAMGQKIIHTGGAGSGQVAKICNNMILGVSMIAVSEAFTLGEQLGLSPKNLFEVVNNSSGQCWAISKYIPVPGILDNVPANNGYKPGFAAAMMLKDLILSQNAAKSAQVDTPLGAQATALYQRFSEHGLGDLDFSAIIKLVEQFKEN